MVMVVRIFIEELFVFVENLIKSETKKLVFMD